MAKWIVDWYNETVTCSECGAREDAFVTRDSFGGGEWAVWGDSLYCPTCGAKMEGKVDIDDEEDI